MARKEKCGECYWSSDLDTFHYDIYCNRFPPVYGETLGPNGNRTFSKRPKVDENDFCGEFKPKVKT